MKYFTLIALTRAIKVNNEALITSSTSNAEVTKLVLTSNPDFVGYLIQNGPEIPEALAQVDSEYRFDADGKVTGTSFLSLDLLTIA